MRSNGPRWSADVSQADWIANRLTAWDGDRITHIVPSGFGAYARVLHRVEPGEDDAPPVRWADVARWSGRELRPDAQYHSVALPPSTPAGPPPHRGGGGGGPREGTLEAPDAMVVAALCREWTSTPEDCWFCVWDGFGWDNTVTFTAVRGDVAPGNPGSGRLPDPVPADVRGGPRVRLPNRDYLLYQGPAESVADLADLDGPNLWWPADRAWCVATDIDLPWTYVGGPHGLIHALLADDRIEALPATPGDLVYRVEDWVAAWVESMTGELLDRGESSLATSRGSVRAWLTRRGLRRTAQLRIETVGAEGTWGSSSHPALAGGARLRDELGFYLTQAIIGLA